ncbi:MAG: MOSC N-terminal beta barrel domain-containing protein [Ginsengibacter sp.]
MDSKPIVSRITIYPVKSLDGVALQKGMIAEGGCISHDREYAIADENGDFIIGKNNSLIYLLRSTIDVENGMISFRHQDETIWHRFKLQNEKQEINEYLSAYFGMRVTLLQNKQGRFMDMPDVSGITFVSTASLQSVSGWYNGMDMEEVRKRFRTTIEIEGVTPFWEDHFFAKEGTAIEFTIGSVTVFGISPRARCVVPTRNSETGETIFAFAKTFAKHRAAAMPGWSTLEAYGHYYHLTVNCHVPAGEIGKWINVGDEVKIIGEKILQ